MLTRFQGTARPLISYLGPVPGDPEKYLLRIRWIEGENVGSILWEETAKVPNGYSYLPQISGEGEYRPGGGIMVEPDGTRHRILNAEVGKIGGFFGDSNIGKS